MTNDESAPKIEEKVAGDRAMLEEESFVREVCRISAVADFERDAEEFARTLWPLVERFAEVEYDRGKRAGKKKPGKKHAGK